MHWKIDVKSKRMVNIMILMKYLINSFYKSIDMLQLVIRNSFFLYDMKIQSA